uniref:Uncharacterized protein n=1 Tax=Cacopsylla melanoneura TaxID=428564 RepID=A0A8D8VYA5_9HEMI
MEYIQHLTSPNTCCLVSKSNRDLHFRLKIRAVMSCLSLEACPGKSNCFISSHAGLQVKVMNRSGRPHVLTNAIASCAYSCMCLGLPVNVDGRIVGLPNSVGSTLPSLATASRRWTMWTYCSHLSLV